MFYVQAHPLRLNVRSSPARWMQQLLFGLLLSRTTEMTARLFEMPLVLRVVSSEYIC